MSFINKKFVFLILCLFVLANIGCSNANQVEVTSKSAFQYNDLFYTPQVIYGTDDRKDPYQVKDPFWIERAKSTVALVSNSSIKDMGTYSKIESDTFGSSYGLCQSEPFFKQINPAFCSGSLIAEDLILSAGHCMSTESDCKNTSFVFDFGVYNASDDPSLTDKSKVYGCKEIVHSQVLQDGSDFSIIRLNRSVTDRAPLKLSQAGTIKDNESVLVIGHPVGLPVKLSGNAKVRDNLNKPYFIANLDTYGGNSGSGVFNETTGEIEGILVRGEVDFKTTSKGCRISNVCKDNACRGEDVTRVSEVLPFLPK